ncbi:Queuosine Biosynthesis QueE Radical SAM [Lachnospiraceae bacterium TWA4]|nr:Queuosine Biosynthesis QueE Radical SAM [Lachnospiraceae bacterium TWA4]
MRKYPIIEIFTSINGEGTRAGELATFIRLKGCNLHCSYCDTRYACEEDASCTWMTIKEILAQVTTKNVTLTGGEPLLAEGIEELLEALRDYSVEIETNGSRSINLNLSYRPIFTLDYKLPSSGMEEFMNTDNYKYLQPCDVIKFVSGSTADLEKMWEITKTYDLVSKCHVYISPVFGAIEPADIVEFMKEHQMEGVRLQLQLHKFIWAPNKKGV